MLYVSTANKAETYTAHRVLRDVNKGCLVPFQLQPFDSDELMKLFQSNFHTTCAAVLNHFFSLDILPSDIEFAVGRNVGICQTMNHKITVAENWRNAGNSYEYFERSVYSVLVKENNKDIPSWVRTAIRIATLFGVYTKLYNRNVREFDFVTDTGESITYLAAVYARKMGLPIRTIIIGCDEKSGLWDLIHKGEFSTSNATFCIDPVIYALAGEKECSRFLECKANKKTYRPDEEVHASLSSGLFAAVVGDGRVNPIIGSIWRSNRYLIPAETAVAYSALQDFRAKTGESCDALLMSNVSPVKLGRRIQNATGLTQEQIVKSCAAVKE